MRKTEFKEQQKFTQWWLWLLLAGVALLMGYGVYKQLFLGETFGSKPMSDTGLIIAVLFVVGVTFLMRTLRLETIMDEKEITVRFFPFVKKTVEWKEVKSIKIVNYGLVGGWGIRFWTKYGTVYNTKGNKGLAVEPKSGGKFLIGTQKPLELEAIVQKIEKDELNK